MQGVTDKHSKGSNICYQCVGDVKSFDECLEIPCADSWPIMDYLEPAEVASWSYLAFRGMVRFFYDRYQSKHMENYVLLKWRDELIRSKWQTILSNEVVNFVVTASAALSYIDTKISPVVCSLPPIALASTQLVTDVVKSVRWIRGKRNPAYAKLRKQERDAKFRSQLGKKPRLMTESIKVKIKNVFNELHGSQKKGKGSEN